MRAWMLWGSLLSLSIVGCKDSAMVRLLGSGPHRSFSRLVDRANRLVTRGRCDAAMKEARLVARALRKLLPPTVWEYARIEDRPSRSYLSELNRHRMTMEGSLRSYRRYQRAGDAEMAGRGCRAVAHNLASLKRARDRVVAAHEYEED